MESPEQALCDAKESLASMLQNELLAEQITDILATIHNAVPPEEAVKYIVNTLIPQIFTTAMMEYRNRLVKLTMLLIDKYPISFLEPSHIQHFKKQIKNGYVQKLQNLRNAHDPVWSQIWILIVRYLQHHLHDDIDCSNCLFRVVEHAFRSAKDLMGAYDCWKELIHNYKLNEAYIQSPKHVKLLLTPLKVKFSSLDAALLKRFEVFVELLKALKGHAVNTTLLPFLSFCFGPLVKDENVKNAYLGKSCPLIWKKATGVLLEIMGHEHLCEGPDCWEGIEYAHSFEVPVITANNFIQFYSMVISAVIECTLLLEKWADEVVQKKVIRCLWGTLFALTKTVSNNSILTAIEEKIYLFLSECLPLNCDRIESEKVQHTLLLSLLDMEITHVSLIIKHLVNSKHSVCGNAILSLFKICSISKENPNFFQLMTNAFATSLQLLEKDTFVMLWTHFSELLVPNNHAHIDATECATYLLSVLFKIKDQEEPIKIKWQTTYSSLCQAKQGLEQCLMNKTLKHVENNPLDSKRVAPRIVAWMLESQKKSATKNNFDVVKQYLQVLHDILQCPLGEINLNDTVVSLKALMTTPVPEKEQLCFAQKLSNCILLLLTKHKEYSILEDTKMFLLNMPAQHCTKCANILQNELLDLAASGQEVAQKAVNILTVLVKNKPKLHFSRGAKLTNMAVSSLDGILQNIHMNFKATQLNVPKTVANVVPTNVRRLNKTAPNEEFVVVTTEYKFNKAKLSTQQKEKLRRRRDDIPSLYQDLTQDSASESLSQDNSLPATELKEKADANETETVAQTHCAVNKETVEIVTEIPDVVNKENTIQEEVDEIKKTVAQIPSTHYSATNKETTELMSEIPDLAGKANAREEIREFRGTVAQTASVQNQETREVAQAPNAISTETAEVQENTEGYSKQRRSKRKSSIAVNQSTPAHSIASVYDDDKKRMRIVRELQRLEINAKGSYITNKRTRQSVTEDTFTLELLKAKKKAHDIIDARNNAEVIESSQENIINITPVQTPSTDRCSFSSETKTQINDNLNPQKDKESCNSCEVLKESITDSTPTPEHRKAAFTESQITNSKKDTESCDPYELIEVASELNLNTPKKPDLDETGKELSEKNTDSLETDLPGSPVTKDTPERRSELLHSTCDISPIKSEETQQSNTRQRVNQPTNRSARLIALLPSPLDVKEGEREGEAEADGGKDLFLNLERELPSCSAIPSGGSILKRRRPDFSDDSSPCLKRKRVNFSDPPTTSTKFIDVGEPEQIKNKRKRKCSKQLYRAGMKNATVLKDKTDDSTAEVKSAESPILSDNVEEKITEAPVENIGETEPSVERVSDTEAKDGNVITQNELKAVVENILEAIKKSDEAKEIYAWLLNRVASCVKDFMNIS